MLARVLLISRAQYEAFATAHGGALEARLLARLRRFFPGFDARSGRKDVAFVRYGAARARVYGFTSDRDVAEYLGLMAHWGEDFDRTTRDPVVLAALKDIGSPPRERMAGLTRHACSHGVVP